MNKERHHDLKKYILGRKVLFRMSIQLICETSTHIQKYTAMYTFRFQGKPFNIMVIQAYAPTSNAEEAEVEWFYKDLQELLELTPQKDVLFIIGDWNAKVKSRNTWSNRQIWPWSTE